MTAESSEGDAFHMRSYQLLAALEFEKDESLPDINLKDVSEGIAPEACGYTRMSWRSGFIEDANLFFGILLSEVPDFLCSTKRAKLQRNHWHTLLNTPCKTWEKLQNKVALLVEQVNFVRVTSSIIFLTYYCSGVSCFLLELFSTTRCSQFFVR